MARKSGSRGGLKALSIKDLHAEIRRRERSVGSLLRRREKLLEQLSEVNEAIARAGVSVAARGGARPKNDMNLVQSLAKVLRGKTMSVTESAAAVRAAGYKTTAANFRTIVNQALIKNTKIFKKIGRGQYTAA